MRQGKALVYTPNVFAPGSSVSHWDVEAHPNLLMEPFITNSVSSDPDLTVNELKDIGWFGTPGPCGPVAAQLAIFSAEGRDDGILLRWQFSEPENVAAVRVERSEGPNFPWSAVDVTLGTEAGVTTGLDIAVERDRDYLYRLSMTDNAGHVYTMGLASGRRVSLVASGVFMDTPYPNPASHGATVAFRISRPEFVRLAIVDVKGRQIRLLHEGMMPAGDHVKHWDGATAWREAAPAGVYLVSLRTSDGVKTQRITVSH